MTLLRLSVLFSLFLLWGLLPAAFAQQWPQWRGPNRDGRVPAASVPENWPDSLTLDWKSTVGEGHASPVVSGERVYQFSRQGEQEILRCLDLASGREIWKEQYTAPYTMHNAARNHGKGPKSTPIVASGRVITLGISGILTCRDAETGQQQWQHVFDKTFKATSPLYGTAMSPMVLGSLCLAHVGGPDDGALAAFDLQTGKLVWAWKEDGPAYTSPILALQGGKQQVITQTQQFCVSLDPQTGDLLWKFPFRSGYDQNSVTPITDGERIIFGAWREPTISVVIDRNADGVMPKTQWHSSQIPLFMSTPVIVGDSFYGMTDRNSGQLFCASLEDGKVRWQGEPRLGDNASVMATDSVLMVSTTDGEFLVAKTNPDEYEQIAQYQVSESPVWAHPAVVQGKLLVKDATTLACFSLSPQE